MVGMSRLTAASDRLYLNRVNYDPSNRIAMREDLHIALPCSLVRGTYTLYFFHYVPCFCNVGIRYVMLLQQFQFRLSCFCNPFNSAFNCWHLIICGSAAKYEYEILCRAVLFLKVILQFSSGEILNTCCILDFITLCSSVIFQFQWRIVDIWWVEFNNLKSV